MESQVEINRRTTILVWVLVACAALFGLRLFYLQIVRHNHYAAQAIAEHEKKFVLPAERGKIYAYSRDTLTPLVLNEPVYLLFADPRYVRDAEDAAQKIAAVVGGDIDDYRDILSDRERAYAVLAKGLSKTQAEKIEDAELYGIGLKEDQRRVYPEGQLGAQILGFVNDSGEGQYGVEAQLDQRLKGEEGLLHTVTDVHGIPLTINTDNVLKAPQNGDDIALTVDRNIQGQAEEILKNGLERVGATTGSLLVTDPNSGAVVAMANYPSYNPAEYTKVEDYNVFQNAIVSYPYEVGSVVKVLTVAAGINEGKINKDSTYYNSGAVQVDDARITNALDDVGGVRTMTEVLGFSLNTGVVYILEQLGGGRITYEGRQKLYQYFTEKFNFGSQLGIEVAGEQSGYLFSPDEAEGNNVRYANMSFGQGMTVTMLQLASAFATSINGGNYYKPHVVAGEIQDGKLVNKTEVSAEKGVLSEETSRQIREMNIEAVRSSQAMAAANRPGYNIGGKSGTSQIIDSATGRYIDEDSIGTYVGFGGNETPKYVIMVRVDDAKNGGYAGSAAAAPIFADMSNWLIDYYGIPPIR